MVGGEYMLPQASGAELGMRWSDLRRARPRAIRDSYAVWEYLGDTASNAYYFAPAGGPLQPGSTRGALVAVVMEQSIADSARYRARIEEISSYWQRTTGVISRTDETRVPETVVRSWQLRDLVLELLYHQESPMPGRGWRLQAVVRSSHAEIASTTVDSLP